MRKIGAKGFKVVQDKNGKATLERIPFYGMDRSKKLRGRNSKKSKVVRPSPDHLWGKKNG